MHYTTHIKSKTGWFDINFREFYQYKDLIFLFFKRNLTTRYKQTVFGPLWFIFRPLITVSLYAVIFGRLAGLSTEGTPQFVFYMCGNTLWTFFATCLTQTAATFTANAGIMGKVYFPRLVMPLSSVLTGIFDMLIQIAMLIIIMIAYAFGGHHFNLSFNLLLAPIIILQTGFLGLGCGIIVASMTTKYRDLAVLVGFGVQLWMYATPVVYTSRLVPEKYMAFYMLNPMAPMMECWRNAVTGAGTFYAGYWGISWVFTILILCAGILLFNRVEKTFMDTV